MHDAGKGSSIVEPVGRRLPREALNPAESRVLRQHSRVRLEHEANTISVPV